MVAETPQQAAGNHLIELPQWIQKNIELRDSVPRALSASRDHFSVEQLVAAQRYDLLRLYQHFYNGGGADELVPRLYYDTAQILLYQEVGKKCEARTVLSVGAGKWYENLGMRLALPGLVKTIGFDVLSWKLEGARINLKEFQCALGDDPEGKIHQVRAGDGCGMVQSGFIEGLADDGDSLETFDLVTWVHPEAMDWEMDPLHTFDRMYLTRMHELLCGCERRISEGGSMLIVFDDDTWRPGFHVALFEMMRYAGFELRPGFATVYGEHGFRCSLELWLKTGETPGLGGLMNRDIVFIGNKNAVKVFNSLLANLRKMRERLEMRNDAPLLFILSNCAQGGRNLLLEALVIEDEGVQQRLAGLMWRNSMANGGSGEFKMPLAEFLEDFRRRRSDNP